LMFFLFVPSIVWKTFPSLAKKFDNFVRIFVDLSEDVVKQQLEIYNNALGPKALVNKGLVYRLLRVGIFKEYDEDISRRVESVNEVEWSDKSEIVESQDKEPLGLQDIGALTRTVLIGGTETTINQMLVAFWLLAENRHAQEKLRKEVEETIKTYGTLHMNLDKMEYLDALFHEIVRIGFGIPVLTRGALKDTHVGPYAISKGDMVIFSTARVHTDPYIWENSDPESKGPIDPDAKVPFDPERFIRDPDAKLKVHSFGAGPRRCPGRSMATIVIKLSLCALVQHFDISPPSSPERPKELTIAYKGGSYVDRKYCFFNMSVRK